VLPLGLLLGAAMLPGDALAQKKGQKEEKPKKVLTPAGEVRVLSSKEAREAVKDLRSKVLSARRSAKSGDAAARRDEDAPTGMFLQRLEEVEKLQKVQHSSLVPHLAKVVMNDPALAVRSKAVGALLAQPGKQVLPIAHKLLGDKKLREQGAISGPLIKILSFYGAKKPVWDGIYRDFLEFGPIAQIEICKSIGERKDWDAIELLLEHLDAPKPKDVHCPTNPPAEYWKARWEAWQAFKPALVESMQKLLGKEFYTRKQAEEWIEEQGGIRKLRQSKGR
jgi:hypothetical protein